jgi:hypothetical protein
MIDIASFITALHNTPHQTVISFAGAGSQALAWLHSVGGSSRTVLEATNHYAARSLSGLVGETPSQFTSPEVAGMMATQAYLRACELAAPDTPKIGIGCTAAIATDYIKRGEHRVCVAAHTATEILTYNLTMRKGQRSRQEEEHLVSLLLLSSLAVTSGVKPPYLPLLVEEQLNTGRQNTNLISRLLAGEYEILKVLPGDYYIPVRRLPGQVVLSGSFNPLHRGHLMLAQVVRERRGRPVIFELPLINADKAPVNVADASVRTAQFNGRAVEIILTRAPLFNQKARLFPHSLFVIGVDTAVRLMQPRFYQGGTAGMHAALDEIRTAGCRFLVAGRLQGSRFVTLANLDLPDGYRELFEAIPGEVFRQDISSTELRANG